MAHSTRVYHIAPAADVERAARSGRYAPASFAAEGFIHCSYAGQVTSTADRFFRGQHNLLLLEIDPQRLTSEIVAENLEGGDELYPHLYAELPMSAVTAIRELRCTSDGGFEAPCIVAEMHALDDYLSRHFLAEHAFAKRCGLEVDELRDLIRRELAPAPSYVVRDGLLHSFVFGALPAPEATPGSYFHPAMVDWVVRARADLAARGPDAAPRHARQQFADEFAAALRTLDGSIYRLPDAFDEQGHPIDAGLNARISSAWEHFLRGTFGLCVANPKNPAEIARKEVLQEKLTALTDNGARLDFAAAEREVIEALIDDYARASMPFSPVEYSRSSRKRLVDDLRARLKQ